MRAPQPAAPAVVLFAALMLVACGGAPHHFNLDDVSHAKEPALELPGDPSAAGKPLSARDLRGDWVVLYFGYTHCPDVCPLTLAKLNMALRALKPAQARKIRVIFVTVDPKRDASKVLLDYVHAFNPRFMALRTTGQTLARLTRRYHVAYGYGKPDASGSYTVRHSSQFMVFGPKGRMRLIGDYQDSTKAITADLGYVTNTG